MEAVVAFFSPIYILMLAGILGYEIIGKVPVILHTPLMSGTNAIHGIVVLGALVVFGHLPAGAPWSIKVILFVALVFGTLNVVGGYVVTDRMLGMFKPKKPVTPQTAPAVAEKGADAK